MTGKVVGKRVLTEPPYEDPLLKRDAPGRLCGEVYGYAQERVCKAIVRCRLCGEDTAKVQRHVLGCELPA